MIRCLAPEEIFVFGSNENGYHHAGAARQAHRDFGAEYGIGEGLTGRSYAFPSLGRMLQKRSFAELEKSRDSLYACCVAHPDKRFLLTKVGCGIAGYQEDFIRSLFAKPPANLILPDDWRTQ